MTRYFDPETKSIQQQQQQPPGPPDDGFGGAVAVNDSGLYSQLRPSKITESDINVQGWDDIVPQQVLKQSQPLPYPSPPGGTAGGSIR